LVVPAPELEFYSAQEIGARMVPVAEDMLMRGFNGRFCRAPKPIQIAAIEPLSSP